MTRMQRITKTLSASPLPSAVAEAPGRSLPRPPDSHSPSGDHRGSYKDWVRKPASERGAGDRGRARRLWPQAPTTFSMADPSQAVEDYLLWAAEGPETDRGRPGI